VLCIRHIYVTYVIHNLAIDFFGHPLIKATVPSLHVKDGDLSAFGRDSCKAAVGITEQKQSIWLLLGNYLIGLGNHVAYGLRNCCADSIQEVIGTSNLQLSKKYLVQLIIIIYADPALVSPCIAL
jgi:hypothetical protein